MSVSITIIWGQGERENITARDVSDGLRQADAMGARNIRINLEGGAVERLIRIGGADSSWVAL